MANVNRRITTPNEPEKVTGSECLEWIDKKIGFGSHVGIAGLNWTYSGGMNASQKSSFMSKADADMVNLRIQTQGYKFNTTLIGWNHDDTIRKVGLVTKHFSDGGIRVAILSTDSIDNNPYGSPNIDLINQTLNYLGARGYERISVDPTVDLGYKQRVDAPFPNYPNVILEPIANYSPSYSETWLSTGESPSSYAGYDEYLNYAPYITQGYGGQFGNNWTYRGQDFTGVGTFHCSTDKTNTFVFGEGYELTLPATFPVNNAYLNDPLHLIAGNLYDFVTLEAAFDFIGMCPARFLSYEDFEDFENYTGQILFDTNFTSIPYNLILTENESEALDYLSNGTIPSDAYLYPLDWTNFPNYNAPDDDGSDGDDENDDGDNGRDIKPNLPSKPSYTPAMFSNYNWYWLTAAQFEDFIRWFWFDVGNITDLQDILDKISGMYNNLAEAVLMVRYFPVDVSWIGGEGTPGNIKLAMLEKSGSYKTISTVAAPNIQDVGSIRIPSKYKSFVDLSPYSVVSVYLPFHGFVDLDINILSGHTLDVKAVYDHLTGTVLYLLYYDNTMLINTFVCKMAVDIPITLQTKNDRDSAIFSNVSNTVSGLMGAGISFASGNPIGLMVGANAFNSGTSTAPLNVKGTIGESGAFYAPDKCYLIVRRPTISKPDTWKYNVGQMCGQSYRLDSLKDKGLTITYKPRVEFKNTTPMQSEVDEIYKYLEEGVIL